MIWCLFSRHPPPSSTCSPSNHQILIDSLWQHFKDNIPRQERIVFFFFNCICFKWTAQPLYTYSYIFSGQIYIALNVIISKCFKWLLICCALGPQNCNTYKGKKAPSNGQFNCFIPPPKKLPKKNKRYQTKTVCPMSSSVHHWSYKSLNKYYAITLTFWPAM